MGMDEVELDEDMQGEPWPPPGCPLATIVEYGGSAFSPFNNVVVELGAYFKEHGYFEAHITKPVRDSQHYPAGEVILCSLNELHIEAPYTKMYVASWTEQEVVVYADHVYDLRDDLDKTGVAVTAEAVSEWTTEQRIKIRAYLTAISRGLTPSVPEELR